MFRPAFVLSLCVGLTVLTTTTGHAQDQDRDRVVRLLEELTNAHGPSGFEAPVREIVRRELREYGADLSTGGLGSVIGEVRGTADAPRIMVTAHMDELGLLVQFIRPDGFLRFKTLGGWFDQALVDQRWEVRTGDGILLGVTGIQTIHVADRSERDRVWPVEELFIDVGATSKAEAERMGIRPGDSVAPWSPFTVIGQGRYAAKAWDDRVGIGVMLEALHRMRERGVRTPNTLVLVATTQEEIGLRGAHTAVRMARPDLGISIEAGVAADYPGARPEQAQERLGAGPGIFLLDSSMIPNTRLRDFFFRVAEEEGIPLQPDVLYGYGEDGAEIQRYDTGRPSVNITVPTRYLHSHTGIIDRDDFDRAVELLIAVLQRLDAPTVREIASF